MLLFLSIYTGWLSQVPSQHVQRPQDNLTEFKKDIPVLGILGVPHFIHSMNPFSIDPDVRLVCKYLKAYQLGEHLLSIQGKVSDSIPDLFLCNEVAALYSILTSYHGDH